ncbi:TatD family hydrolase [Puniceicoccus vermicola]|uniref:TatD family hydrolase n=1 Tax=Puniceicoccus vermicola TaxID=388746 RepID=A0A7X1E4N8_9BACT|nr:TatD family hydrolase [Puniceicoccus vermicola]MBC2602254.1 TatD family hydrolase [Puniceicoccus vermicola]
MSLHLIDSHCHPPEESGETELSTPEWLQRSQEAGVRECIAIGTDLDDWSRYQGLAKRFPGIVHWTAGLHPCHVEENYEEVLAQLPPLLRRDQAVPPCALGEIGLDFTRLPKDRKEVRMASQRNAFVQQLEMAKEHDLPVVIHSRGTVSESLEILSETKFPCERAIFHCFSEGEETLETIRATGARCSFTGIITFKNAREVREALEANGLENLILETDSPYLSPEPYRGKKNEPARVARLAEYCAEFFATTPEKIAEISRRNTRDFFRLPPSE